MSVYGEGEEEESGGGAGGERGGGRGVGQERCGFGQSGRKSDLCVTLWT